MKNKIWIGFAAVLMIGLVAFVTVAYRGNPDVKSPNYNEDVHEQLEAAMEAGNYDAWLKIRQDNNLPTNGKIYQVITKDNFGKYVELHNANLAGDTEKAEAIRAELGLGQGMMGSGTGTHRGAGSGSEGRYGAASSGCDGSCANHQIIG